LPQLDTWLSFHENQSKTLLVERSGRILELFIPEVDRNFFAQNKVLRLDTLNGPQEKALNAWMLA
jgi:hypothetical protein